MDKENKKFISISDAFLNFWKLYFEFHNWNDLTGKDIANYYIADVIISSYLAELGLKALVANNTQKTCHKHDLKKLFLRLDSKTQKKIATEMGYEFDELLIKLKENNNHFIQWRYYFESKCNTVDIKFMQNLLNVLYTNIVDLRKW